MSPLPTRLLAIACATALGVSACGSSSSTDTVASADPASEPATDPADGNGSGDAPQYGSEEFGLTPEQLTVRIEEVEAAIGECMIAAGFDYIALDAETFIDAMGLDGSLPGTSDEDYLAQYGFGITTRAGEPDPLIVAGRGQNQALFDALPESDQVAYTRTLAGENEDATFVRALEDEDFSETGGCTRTAVDLFFTEDEQSASYVNPGDVLLESDPRLAAAIEDWSTCLADQGFDYANPDDLDDDLADQLDAIVGDQEVADLSGQALDALNELQGLERAVAAISDECESEIIDPVADQIETEIYGAPQN